MGLKKNVILGIPGAGSGEAVAEKTEHHKKDQQ